MKRTIALLAAIVLLAVGSAHALYSVNDTGDWPKSWPKELEPLRKQSRTLDGPMESQLHYAIRFTKREEFEAAWPHILKVKGKGAPIRLVQGPNFFLGKEAKAGVVIHEPTPQQQKKDGKEKDANDALSIELVVDGQIVDLNRIPLPADAQIIDERFKDEKQK